MLGVCLSLDSYLKQGSEIPSMKAQGLCSAYSLVSTEELQAVLSE